ncbi:aminoglycoside 6-adenylyltransferase [Gracilibacillus orientalis]|uniref:Aminoglycoside 6-adenylyltransferase n=1 Tax=Gracilibacillus orientalis TaxID=334253 RepID=A0A1I4RB90_9BACI|nr:aminoglycoside 6-adenylyltransferase [Gracilibacillus orientalis]SFM49153.1 aminoglycoside 6-adenylyltransferase [Gracilibacillus orientalis]
MRSEKEMMDLVIDFAKAEDRVRVVGMNGSRTNTNVKKDHFQDYDIVYIVTEMDSLLQNREWLDYFGERMIMQTPEESSLSPATLGNWFTFLMQFTDGNRIDLMLIPLEELDSYMQNDSLTRIVVDKDNLIATPPIPDESSHYVKRPTAQQFTDSCNEFWWVSPYIAKGLCRGEFLYATNHLDRVLREELLRMIAWNVGAEYYFKVNLGAAYKFLHHYMDANMLESLQETYQLNSMDKCWNGLFLMQKLFQQQAKKLADRLEFNYPDHFEKVIPYIQKLHQEFHQGS